MRNATQYATNKDNLSNVKQMGVNQMLLDIIQIYTIAEKLVDAIQTMDPLQKIQNFKKVDKMLYKIDANLAEVLKLYSSNISNTGNKKYIRLTQVFIDYLIFSLFEEINHALRLLNN